MTDVKNYAALFQQSGETIEDAKRKAAEEAKKKAMKFFKMDKNDRYLVRILPNAPLINENGELVVGEDGKPKFAGDRKSYEYPIQSLTLGIAGDNKKMRYVTVVRGKYAGLPADIVDAYVTAALNKYADSQDICKRIKSNSFSGGLKWDSKRAMYILDMNKPTDGIQILQLSYAQYKELEDRKMSEWAELIKEVPDASCPISSIQAYPIEIYKKEGEGGKTEYQFTIKTRRVDNLSEEVLEALIAAPRIPDTIYHYSRYTMEATIEYLKQYDAKHNLSVFDSKEVQDAIEQVKGWLSPDDTSHFSLNGKEDGKEENIDDMISSFYDKAKVLEKDGLKAGTPEYSQLKNDIREFCDAHNIDVVITRTKSIEAVLADIEDYLEREEAGDNDETPEDEPEAEEAGQTPAPAPEDEDDEDDEPASTPSKGEHNDDTNEPARRPRPARNLAHSPR